jgi:hypothetical protein
MHSALAAVRRLLVHTVVLVLLTALALKRH